jgi:serine kinase of HPr protein (carbohydrate metabolism regulator)
MILHATTVARYGPGGWSGVLIRGPSGAGKSGLALRLLAAGWRLVADDRTVAWASGGRLWGRAPAAIAGLIEVRGVGVAPAPTIELAPIMLAVSPMEPGETLERIPEPAETEILGVRLAELKLSFLEEGSGVRLMAALTMLGRSEHPAYLAPSRGPEASLAGGVSR